MSHKQIWRPLEGLPADIADPVETPRGWVWAVRAVRYPEGTVAGRSDYAPTREAAIAAALAAAPDVVFLSGMFSRRELETVAPAAPPAVDLTDVGLQYVIPGCEKDPDRGPAQLSLF